MSEISREHEHLAQNTLADKIRKETNAAKLALLKESLVDKEATTVLPPRSKGWKSDFPVYLRSGPGSKNDINGIKPGAKLTIIDVAQETSDTKRGNGTNDSHIWYKVRIDDRSQLNTEKYGNDNVGWVSAEFLHADTSHIDITEPDPIVNPPENIDKEPDPFDFKDKINQPLNQHVAADETVTINGINNPTPLTITNGEYSLNGGATWGNVPIMVTNGQTIKIRNRTSTTYNTPTTTTVNIGGIEDTYTTTTVKETAPVPPVEPVLVPPVVPTEKPTKNEGPSVHAAFTDSHSPDIDSEGLRPETTVDMKSEIQEVVSQLKDAQNRALAKPKFEMASRIVEAYIGAMQKRAPGLEGKRQGAGFFNGPETNPLLTDDMQTGYFSGDALRTILGEIESKLGDKSLAGNRYDELFKRLQECEVHYADIIDKAEVTKIEKEMRGISENGGEISTDTALNVWDQFRSEYIGDDGSSHDARENIGRLVYEREEGQDNQDLKDFRNALKAEASNLKNSPTPNAMLALGSIDNICKKYGIELTDKDRSSAQKILSDISIAFQNQKTQIRETIARDFLGIAPGTTPTAAQNTLIDSILPKVEGFMLTEGLESAIYPILFYRLHQTDSSWGGSKFDGNKALSKLAWANWDEASKLGQRIAVELGAFAAGGWAVNVLRGGVAAGRIAMLAGKVTATGRAAQSLAAAPQWVRGLSQAINGMMVGASGSVLASGAREAMHEGVAHYGRDAAFGAFYGAIFPVVSTQISRLGNWGSTKIGSMTPDMIKNISARLGLSAAHDGSRNLLNRVLVNPTLILGRETLHAGATLGVVEAGQKILTDDERDFAIWQLCSEALNVLTTDTTLAEGLRDMRLEEILPLVATNIMVKQYKQPAIKKSEPKPVKIKPAEPLNQDNPQGSAWPNKGPNAADRGKIKPAEPLNQDNPQGSAWPNKGPNAADRGKIKPAEPLNQDNPQGSAWPNKGPNAADRGKIKPAEPLNQDNPQGSAWPNKGPNAADRGKIKPAEPLNQDNPQGSAWPNKGPNAADRGKIKPAEPLNQDNPQGSAWPNKGPNAADRGKIKPAEFTERQRLQKENADAIKAFDRLVNSSEKVDPKALEAARARKRETAAALEKHLSLETKAKPNEPEAPKTEPTKPKLTPEQIKTSRELGDKIKKFTRGEGPYSKVLGDNGPNHMDIGANMQITRHVEGGKFGIGRKETFSIEPKGSETSGEKFKTEELTSKLTPEQQGQLTKVMDSIAKAEVRSRGNTRETSWVIDGVTHVKIVQTGFATDKIQTFEGTRSGDVYNGILIRNDGRILEGSFKVQETADKGHFDIVNAD